MIKQLDQETTLQIAAGEVIERPRSIVKELLENSIDADADNVTLDIQRAGIASIRIQDNGKGIDKSDLQLALTRHATSKINDINDLIRITQSKQLRKACVKEESWENRVEDIQRYLIRC